MVRPKAVTDVRPRSALTALSASTATVTVLRPPAVEPGEPPISMSTHATACEGSVSALWSMVLKPAVRSVTVWNAAASSLCGTLMPPSVAGLLHSNSSVSTKPPPSSTPDMASTSLLCRLRRRKRL